jgi:hypothetical protein
MSTEIQKIEIDPLLLEQRKAGWARMGELVYTSELELQVMAQQPLLDLKLPTTIEEIVPAENKLKEIKAVQKSVENKRKELTAKFDDVSKRLMIPEKSLLEPIENLAKAIIVVKKEHEKIEAEKKAKEARIIKAKEFLLIEKARKEASLKESINILIDSAYTNALGSGNISLEALPDYLAQCKSGLNTKRFSPQNPLTEDELLVPEIKALADSIWVFDTNYWLGIYHDELDKKFSDYEIALLNKVKALEISAKENEAKHAEIQAENRRKEVAAQLQSNATPILSEGPAIKALKKSYEVDMPETVESVMAIMGAFSANLNACLSELRVSKWFSFTPSQAAGALGKLKSKDNNFNPSGIIFKEVDKL